jgi:hypothetical protein
LAVAVINLHVSCVELYPSLSRCIETVAREEYWNLASQLMKSGQEDEELQQKVELLKGFLESAEFGKLRSQSEKYLIEGKKVKFIIYWKEAEPNYEMKVI